MKEYLSVFIEDDYPDFINKYLNTKTMERIKNVTQFCGSDYSNLYNPRFLYTRFDHSVVVSCMTWHFTHSKKETIAALLHDAGTPCFAHCIDYVFGDYIEQSSSELKTSKVVEEDEELLKLLESDGIKLEELDDLSNYQILENKTPKLCADRLDGVLHTSYIWLNIDELDKIKEVYNDLTVLINEDGKKEIGFRSINQAENFAELVYTYAKELKGNTDKYVMNYIAELVKKAVSQGLITLDDLYHKKEEEICEIFDENFKSWQLFRKAYLLERDDEEPTDSFYVSLTVKNRNVIPLVDTEEGPKRITEASEKARRIYKDLDDYKDSKYAYVKEIKSI